MQEWLIVLSLIFIGIGLLIVEVVLIPGTTVVGIAGFLCMLGGLYASLNYFGNPITTYLALGTGMFSLLSILYALQSGAWKRYALKSQINSRVNEETKLALNVGDIGIANSALRPSGKASFGDIMVEVRTMGKFVDARHKVKIIQIEDRRIFVEPINTV